MYACVLGCCLLFVVSGVSAQSNSLRWLVNDFPPYTDVTGQLPGTGIADDVMRYLQARLPQYHHEFEVASFARTYAQMELGEPICHPTTLKLPGRDKAMLFSRPILFLQSQQVWIRQDQLSRVEAYLDDQGQIDVQRLLGDTGLVTTISERRGYSPLITAALKEVGAQPHVLKAGVNFSAPYQQLLAGWIDYLFVYPTELGWYRRMHQNESSVALRGFAVAGDQPYVLTYISCTRSAWGEHVIRDIDQQLKLAGPRPPWKDRVVEFTASEDRRRYEESLTRSQPFTQP
ncbi:hypothetical protein [Pseudomonas anguilliseptica]|uniref:hypothetical protein n=1 Tax=Pseudomonas anguilliseptica TaxID=53406 RepID=UPI0022B053E7|nr:hypothetical protein [Pseudomonas anguilliseptica]MCZ4321871.1 hypothetical protein [Pseudomonas anguilliseptica]